jgi:peptidoglycan/LPS O-acetylase OafA/YrhL
VSRRLQFLDALRGIAAVYIVICHMALMPRPSLALPGWAQAMADAGTHGIALFFMLSAFSLFYTMPARLQEPRPALGFYLHRFFRIAPLFYAWLAIRLLRDAVWLGVTHPPLYVAANVFFLFNPFRSTVESLVFGGWTVGVEMLFYAMFPLVYRAASNVWRACALFAGFILLALACDRLFAQQARAEMMDWIFVKHLPLFACGAVMYHLLIASRNRGEGEDEGGGRNGRTADGGIGDGGIAGGGVRVRAAGLLLAAAAIGLYAAYLRDALPPIFGLRPYWLGVIWVMLAIGLALNPVRLVVNRVTAFLGTIGFSLYLNHPLLVYALIRPYRRIGAWFTNPSVSFLVCILLTLAILVPMSALTYRFIEQPGIRLGKRLVRRLSAERPAAETPEKPEKSQAPEKDQEECRSRVPSFDL